MIPPPTTTRFKASPLVTGGRSFTLACDFRQIGSENMEPMLRVLEDLKIVSAFTFVNIDLAPLCNYRAAQTAGSHTPLRAA